MSAGLRACGGFTALLAVAVGLPAVAQNSEADAKNAADRVSAADDTTTQLLDRLAENDMYDVVIWVLDRLDADQNAGKSLRAASPFRRGVALVGLSRRETDSAKRSKILDDAQGKFEAFLKAAADGPAVDVSQRVVAYTQMGNLLVERGRLAVEQSKRAGADAKPLLDAAVKDFDAAFASFESAEKSILETLRAFEKELADLAPPDPKKKGEAGDTRQQAGAKKGKTLAERKRDAARIEEIEEDRERLRGELLNTRLLLGSTIFEKSKAYAVGSEDWKKAVNESTKRYAELYAKYPSRGAGLYGRFYEGRNKVLLAQAATKPEERKKLVEQAVQALGDIRTLEGGGFVPGLRAKAFNSSFECWLDQKDYAGFDEMAEKFAAAALPSGPLDKLDPDWLAMKYRGALILTEKAAAEGAKGRPKLKTAQKIAMEVAKANRDFAKEARELLARLGKDVGEEQTASFEAAMDEVAVLIGSMKGKSTEAKELEKAGKAAEASAAKAEAASFRDKALAAIMVAMPLAGEEDLDQLNRARYLATFFFYDSKRYHEAAALGQFLAERYPNAIGSKDAARIAMASWQLLAKDGVPEWAAESRRRSAELASAIVRIWPEDSGSADAAVVAIASAAEQGNTARIVELLTAVSPDSPRRAEVLIRGGTALWRSVVEQRKIAAADASAAAPEAESKQVLAKAIESIDAGLAAVAASGKPDKLAVAAAVYRCQIGMDAGDNDVVLQTLTNPVYGPWTIVTSGDKSLVDPAVLEEILRLSLRFFIQTEKLDEAQKAMDMLEAAAGEGEDASERLAATYLAMGRELQEQLGGIVGAGASGEVDPAARDRAASIVAGFEKFLERVGQRDKKTSSQMWVATQFLALGAGPGQQGGGGIAQVVPKNKRQEFLGKSAEVYESLLKSDDEKVKQAERSIRLKLATVYRELGRWPEALGHLEWIVSDPKRVNWLTAQIEAATFLEAAGAGEADRAKGQEYLKQAVLGRQDGQVVFWGWSGIAKKLGAQVATAAKGDAKAAETRRLFFEARLNVPRCRMKRAEFADAAERQKQLELAEKDIIFTYKLYPDMGGREFRARFDKMLEEIQKQLGRPSTRGIEDLEAEANG